MTEEELAEEYAIRIINHKMALHDIFEKVKVEYELKQAFLAGLNAKTQWHDLRKDPNDLPKENGEYWVCYADSVHVGHKGYELWLYMNGEWKYTAKVIAWCEVPTFKE